MTDWMNRIFGETVPQPLSYVVLFAAVILAILLLLWIAKKLLGGTFVSGGRGRHLRLAVMDATPVDSRRRLVLVRRDEVEHLILIGGPTDVVVEQNIRLDAQREARPGSAPQPVSQLEPTRPAAQPIVREKTAQPTGPAAEMRPRPPAPPVAPYLPPRPVASPPPPPTTRYAGASQPTQAPVHQQPLQRPVFPPVVQTPPAPMPTVAPVLAGSAAGAVLAAPIVSAPARLPETLRSTDSDIDEGLLADLSETLGFDDESPQEISLEKEMESLLGTLDPQKDRIS
jgi:flagellar biogenesis protein FliO